VNGVAQHPTSTPGAYLSLNRTWQSGDQVEVTLPMRLHFEALPDDPQTVAVLYGPIVLAAEMGRENLPPHGEQALGADHHSYWQDPVPPVPKLVADSAEAAMARIERVPDQPLAFRTAQLGNPADLSLIPFYQLHHQRYAVYLQLLGEAD